MNNKNKVNFKCATLNLSSLTGKGKEVMDFMIRRKIDLLCIQETRWKGSASEDLGSGYKLLYSGGDINRNGVGIVIHPELSLLVKDVIPDE